MKQGDKLTPFQIERIEVAAMRDWSRFLADPNPIHLDGEAVRAMGLGDRPINQGPANLAYVINLLTENFPDRPILSLDTRFTDNVFAGDRVIAEGEIVANEGGVITCRTWLRVDGRGTVLECMAQIGSPTTD